MILNTHENVISIQFMCTKTPIVFNDLMDYTIIILLNVACFVRSQNATKKVKPTMSPAQLAFQKHNTAMDSVVCTVTDDQLKAYDACTVKEPDHVSTKGELTKIDLRM